MPVNRLVASGQIKLRKIDGHTTMAAVIGKRLRPADMTTNPNEQATGAVNRTAQELLAALLAKDSSKVNSYYAADAVIATPGGQGRPGGVQGHQGRY